MNAVRYAGFWKRFAAHLIDSMVLGIVSLIVLVPAIVVLGFQATMVDQETPEPPPGMMIALLGYLVVIVFLVVAVWLYYALMESSSRGATLGKLALGIRVTDIQGNRISFGRATGRYFAKIFSGLTFSIGYLMAGFTQQKQALHDMIAGCLVINA
jgi:uncharacterized RDD family membrane protein YckC